MSHASLPLSSAAQPAELRCRCCCLLPAPSVCRPIIIQHSLTGPQLRQRQQRHPQLRGCTTVTKAADLNTSSMDEAEIENLDRDYCDDFVCTTSPQVEQNVRALARDLQRPKSWTKSLFSRDVSYQGFLRSFKGWDRYKRHTFIADNFGDPQVKIQRLRMEDRGTAVIDWRLQGRILGVLNVDAKIASTFRMNLLTGRVEQHRDKWDLSGTSPPARAALLALRAGWAARQKAKDLSEDSSSLLDRLSPQDDGMGDIQGDPTDPQKFFQDNSRQQFFDDAVKFATLLAILWTLEKLGREILKVG